MRRENGFTLIEMMIVMGIVALVLSVSIPNIFGWIADHKLSQATSDIRSTLQLARLKAVKSNAWVVVDFDPASNEFIAFVDDGKGGGTGGNWVRDGDETVIKRSNLQQGVELSNVTFSEGLVGYDPRGAPLLTGGFFAISEEVHLRNENRTYQGVRINISGNPSLIYSKDGVHWN